MAFWLTLLPVLTGGMIYSRVVSSELRRRDGIDGSRVAFGMAMALAAVALGVSLQLCWLRQFHVFSNLGVVLLTAAAMEFLVPRQLRGLESSRINAAVGLVIFSGAVVALILLLTLFFEHICGVDFLEGPSRAGQSLLFILPAMGMGAGMFLRRRTLRLDRG